MPGPIEADLSQVRLQGKRDDTFSSEEYYNKLGKLVELSDEQKAKLKKKLKKEIEAWKSDTAEQRTRLERWNDLLEGVVEETDFPFQGASQIHIPITAIYCEIYHGIERRSILGSERIWYAETMDDNLRDSLPQIEDALNYKARAEWNIPRALSDVFSTTNRDGLGIMQVPYVEEYEPCKDIVLVSNVDEFMNEFPTPDDAGLSPKDYKSLTMKVEKEATEEDPVEIPISYEKCVYRGPKGEVVELADFVRFPATAQEISHQYCRGYGKRFYLRKGEIKKRIKEGFWYKSATKKFLRGKKGGSNVNSFMRSKDYVDGVIRSDRSDDFEFFEMVYWATLDKAEGESKLLITYSQEEDEIVACLEYPYRVDFYALFHIKRRPNRLVGTSVPQMTEDINEEIDTQHRQRINIRTISSVPSFKGKKESKKDFDANAESNQWRPGVIFWLNDPEAFEQFKVQPTDLGESMAEEQNDMRIISMRTGVEPFSFSGSAQAGDMNAPAKKTELLINQSNLRMDDPIAELRDGVEKVGEICLSHLYQFGPNEIEYEQKDQRGQAAATSIPKRILRKGLKIKMQAVNVVFNADSEFEKWMYRYGMLVKEPIIGNDPRRRLEILRHALWNGRVDGKEKIIPTEPELEQMIKQQQAQQAMAAQAQAAQSQAAAGPAQVAAQAQAAKAQADVQGTQFDVAAKRAKATAAIAKGMEQAHKSAREIVRTHLGHNDKVPANSNGHR